MTAIQARQTPGRRTAPLALALWAAAALWGGQAAAQTLEHRVQPGDTLEALSTHYLGAPQLWTQLQAHNQVANPRHLQPGSVLRIPMHLLPAGSAQVGHVQGQAAVIPPGAAQAVALQPGQPLAEGTRVQVAPDSFVSVRLADGTVIRVQADSEVQLQQLRRRGRAGDAQSVLELHRGGIESSVPPSRGGARRFEIRTPQASTSVRGTRFAVTLADDGRTLAAVTEGALAVEPRIAGDGGPAPQATQVHGGHGLVVTADGRLGAPRALLPAPNLSALPATLHDADFLALTLTPVATAVAYQVQVARDADFTEILRSGTFATPQVRLRGVDDGGYHLSVRAIDDAGLPGRPAQRGITVKAQPVPPLYQAPPAGGTLSRTQGELLCTPVAGAARYRIQVAADATFAAPQLDETHAQHCGARVSALAAGHYFWRVASVRELPGGGADQGPYAPAQPFVVANHPSTPSAAALQTESSGDGLQLRWPGEPGQSFRLQVASAEDFAAPLVDERLQAPAWSSTGLAPGQYFVRIQTRDPSGLESGFSTPRQIRVQAAVLTGTGLPVMSSDGRPLSP